MIIEEKTIKTVAKLARIHLESSEVETLKTQLEGILEWIKQLNEVDTQNIEPLFNVNVSQMPVRFDQVDPTPGAPAVTQNAPDKEFDMFVVPKVVE